VRRRRISGGFESDGDDGSANQLQQAAGGSAIASWDHAVSSTSRPPLTGRERDVLALSNELSRADSELLWRALLSSDSLRWSTPAQLVKYCNSKDDQVRLLATCALLWRRCFDQPALTAPHGGKPVVGHNRLTCPWYALLRVGKACVHMYSS